MTSMIPKYRVRFMIVLNFFILLLGFAITNSALAQANQSIPLPPKLLPSIKLKPASQSTSSSNSSKSEVPSTKAPTSAVKSATSTTKKTIAKTSTPPSNSSHPSKLQCQNKAKEASKIVFDDCMIAVKENEAENIRKEYQVKLAKLKAQYEQKLQKVLGQLKKQSKNGVIPATNETTAAASSSSNLLSKSQNETLEYQDSDSATFSTPTPVNTQDSLAIDESNSLTTTPNNAVITTENLESPESLNKPSVPFQKDAPSPSTDSFTPTQEPSGNNSPSSSSFMPSDKLEAAPDAAI